MQSIEDIPSWLSTAWGIDLISAQVILSVFVIAACIIPFIVLKKDHNDFKTETVFLFIGMALCVALGWLPLWLMIVSIIIVAIAGAVLGGATLGGG